MDRQDLIDLFAGLRVADVSDGMDAVGLGGRGLLDRDIRPLYRDLDAFTHRFAGPALTLRYLPTGRELPNMPPEQFDEYVGNWYREISGEPQRKIIQPGDVLVFDAADLDVGIIGSNNCLAWMNAGAVGVVSNGGARDTDELIKQKCPVYARFISRGFMPGRVEFDAVNTPVNCGGVMVRPGDVIVADGDGVIAVPVEKARTVAAIARGILDSDKRGRRKLYEKRGLPPDATVTG